MSVLRWFRRKRPAPPVNEVLAQISLSDLLVARWWGLSIDEWNALPAIVRADKREQVVYAQRFTP